MGARRAPRGGRPPLARPDRLVALLERVLPVVVGAVLTVLVIGWLAGRVDQPEVERGGTPAAPAGPSLQAGGRELLPPEPGALAAVDGLAAEGDELRVVAVRRAGFFAGRSEDERVFVAWDGERPPVGATVDVLGAVVGVPADAGDPLGIGAAGAALVAEQGGYVLADAVQVQP